MTDKIQIEIDAKWARRVKSPLFWVVSALTGVSVSFAPMFLYQAGQGLFPEVASGLVPVCFMIIYLVPLFYIRLGRDVIVAIQKQSNPPISSAPGKTPPNLSLPVRIWSLLGGSTYLVGVAWVFSKVNETSIWLTLPVIMIGALAIMAVLAILSHKLNRANPPTSRFALSTIFLIAVPVCIYLAAIRWLFAGVLSHDRDAMRLLTHPVALFMLAFWAVFTTAVLLSLAEAMMWLAVKTLRSRAAIKPADQSAPTSSAGGFGA